MKITWTKPHLLDDMITPELYRDEYVNNLSKVINCGLKVKSLSDYVSSIYRGFTPEHKDNNCNSDYLLLKTVNIRRNYLDLSSSFAVSEKVFSENPRYHVNENDALITIMGATDDVLGRAWSFNSKKHFLFSDGVAILKNIKGIDKEYLVSYLNSEVGHKSILQWSSGSTRKYITNERLAKIKIPEPTLEIQNYIGNKVRKAEELREKANKNRREYMSLIDNYFSNVSKDKFPKGSFIINCQNIDSKSQRLDASFYNPIYKEYENLDIEYKKLGDLVKVKTNINPKSDVDYFYYEIGDMSNNVILDKEETIKGKNLPSRAKLNLSKYDIIVSLVQESIEVTSFVDIDRENMLTTNGCAVLAPKDISIAGYLYAIVSSPYFIAQKCRYISGTNIRSLSKEDLLQIPIPIFEYKIIEKINDLVKDEYYSLRLAKQLIREAKQDVEDLIEGKFDESKISEGV